MRYIISKAMSHDSIMRIIAIYSLIMKKVERKTAETKIQVQLKLAGSGVGTMNTQVPFIDHMLQQLAYHAQLDLRIDCQGDKEIDDHHIVEDTGICLGQALNQVLGDKKGILRYGFAYAPLDEALSRAVVDISGRPGLFMRAEWSSARVGDFDTQLVREFFQGFTNQAGINSPSRLSLWH